MNRTTHAIFTLFHYSILIRDTLEYTLMKEGREYNKAIKDFYKENHQDINIALKKEEEFFLNL